MSPTCVGCGKGVEPSNTFCPFCGLPLRPIGGFRPQHTRHTGAVLSGRYRIHGFVARGATARVYLAEDLRDRSLVAVKMFAPSLSRTEELRGRFVREGEAARSLDHPHVVRVLDLGETKEGAPYLVMEALSGETLGDRMRRDPHFAVSRALRLVREAALGLAAVHEAGIVHRDLKPDNLFLVGDLGNARTLKVIDFGMAKLPRVDTGSAEGLVLGTIEYMAPEQVCAGEPVDARTDVYALGVVLFRMLTGHLPFDVEKGTDLLGHQLFSPAPPPSWLREEIDSRVERIVLAAMRKRPENRYPSMEVFLEDLERALGLAPGVPSGRRLRKAPDVYEPSTPTGREAAAFLSKQFRLPVR